MKETSEQRKTWGSPSPPSVTHQTEHPQEQSLIDKYARGGSFVPVEGQAAGGHPSERMPSLGSLTLPHSWKYVPFLKLSVISTCASLVQSFAMKLKNLHTKAKEMAQWLRAGTVLGDDLSTVLRTHIRCSEPL